MDTHPHVICQVSKKMSKRSVESSSGEEVVNKKIKHKEMERFDFTRLDKEVRRQVMEAVTVAKAVKSRQPILLVLHGDEFCDTTSYAYWPATQEVGEWLLQALLITEIEDMEKHVELAQYLGSRDDSEYADAFKGCYEDRIKCQSDLGLFLPIRGSHLEHNPSFAIAKTSLSTWLYTQECYLVA